MDHCHLMEALRTAVLEGRGATAVELRKSIARAVADATDATERPGQKLGSPEVARLVEKIARHAYRVAADDVESLLTTLSEDEVFEIISAAAVEAGGLRVARGLAALEDFHAPQEG